MVVLCVYCEAVIDLSLGEDPPTGEEHSGDRDDPRAPGDWDNICDRCNYGLGLPGGPHVDWTLASHVDRRTGNIRRPND